METGRLRLLDGPTRIGPVSVEPAPGHTPGMQIVLVEAEGETVAFLADLVPTASHLRYPYIMGYDLEPLVTLESKKRILPRAARENWCVVFEHDAEMPLARLTLESGRIAAHALDPQEV
jgi:glyoxylase-like metal-dependent hydrolase (beta-lactamase superfamily II)